MVSSGQSGVREEILRTAYTQEMQQSLDFMIIREIILKKK